MVIMGGGLAGLCLGLQLRQLRPQTSILIAEKRSGPAPEAAFKVGESTVEQSAHYFADFVGMRDHLDAEQLPKAGLRFFWSAGDNTDLGQRAELGAVVIPPVPSWQLDRGRFENELMARNRAQENTEVPDGCEVTDVELRDGDHLVTLTVDGATRSVEAPWVVDATGYRQLIKRKLGLEKDVEHTINSSWFRLAGGIDIEEWVDDDGWMGRMSAPGIRKLSTNHLMGQGYWVWLIPLASGSISIGIVADPRYHPFEEFDTIEKALAWIDRHEPQLGGVLRERSADVQDFLKAPDFAYGCERVFSPDRWAMTGISGVFIDPFYSPGSDFIGLANTMVADMVARSLDGEDVAGRVEALNARFLTTFEHALNRYTGLYEIFGNAVVQSTKVGWDYSVYWAYPVPLFMHRKWTDLEFMDTVGALVDHGTRLDLVMQRLFMDWHRLEQDEARGRFCPFFVALVQMHLALDERLEDGALRTRLEENVGLMEAMAVIVFHRAARALGDRAPDPGAKVVPAAIGLDPDRWDADGLYGEGGLTLLEANERFPGVEAMWFEQAAELPWASGGPG